MKFYADKSRLTGFSLLLKIIFTCPKKQCIDVDVPGFRTGFHKSLNANLMNRFKHPDKFLNQHSKFTFSAMENLFHLSERGLFHFRPGKCVTVGKPATGYGTFG